MALAMPAYGLAAQELDVPTPYLSSTPLNVDEMLRLAAVTPSDTVYDLGSGDGRVIIAAARDYGARGVGVELDAKLVAESAENARRAGVADRASFRQADVLTVPVGDATVVTMYLLPPLVRKLQDRLYADLRPGARIVAHDYPFPDWGADRRVVVSKTFYLYTVPAHVEGTWKLALDAGGARTYDLQFQQRYEQVKGAARVKGGILPAFEARVSGEHVAFILADGDYSCRYEGTVRGDRMDGTVRWGYGPAQNTGRWHATRAAEKGDR
ncbi:MAG: SAM-dependent methyltransferase [Rhodospirillaceae bacterium]